MVNRLLAADTEDEFVTLFLGRLDAGSASFSYASAGHVTGYLVDAEGRPRQRLESTAIPLGVVPEAPFPAGPAVVLGPGEFILLLTDGVTDARSPDDLPFGSDRALAVARLYRRDPACLIVANLYGAVRAFMQDEPQYDDISIVVIKRRSP